MNSLNITTENGETRIFINGEEYITLAVCAFLTGYTQQRIYSLCQSGLIVRNADGLRTRRPLKHVRLDDLRVTFILKSELNDYPWR